jgi:uncharacterized protein YyaL (SSP411 family)
MPNRLANAVSPYLRSHADNPVDWREWGDEAFADAAARDVPVLVSIGYSTCHWCHVMARESFSDPAIADYLNANFVAIKVDREEYPDVDASYLAAASAFTPNLGWPLNVFVTPTGKPFFAGTYFPPVAVGEHPPFRAVLGAVREAWTERREHVDESSAAIATALQSSGALTDGDLPDRAALDQVVGELEQYEDREFGGFGGAPKFPVATVLTLLIDLDSPLAERTLDAMAASPLRDTIDGGFFRYATKRDWSEPHFERMLYDNALLLAAYARTGRAEVARGIAGFLLTVLRLPSGGFASAQDSESVVDGVRVEGAYYALSAENRAKQPRPALDEKVLTGWNGLAIESLALAGRLLDEPEWIAAARSAADFLLAGDTIVRAQINGRVSSAPATLEDYGMLAAGLVELAIATGEVRYAIEARRLVAHADAIRPDETLRRHGLAVDTDPSEGAYPSGTSAMAAAVLRLYSLTAETGYLESARAAMRQFAPLALERPIAFGAALSVMATLASDNEQLVVVVPDESGTGERDGAVASVARHLERSGIVSIVVSTAQAEAFAAAGFELFESRSSRNGLATAYLCRDFVCKLPITDPIELRAALA